mmetsp:Transcript_5042/g.12877  ORF Transcript_5042/g.12877 Transcript_5042/m.12877 type:complete len:99 (-) Transcript_5042:1553-1849(-)
MLTLGSGASHSLNSLTSAFHRKRYGKHISKGGMLPAVSICSIAVVHFITSVAEQEPSTSLCQFVRELHRFLAAIVEASLVVDLDAFVHLREQLRPLVH